MRFNSRKLGLSSIYIASSILGACLSISPASAQQQTREDATQLEAPLLQSAQCVNDNSHRYGVKALKEAGSTISVNKRPYNSEFYLIAPTKSTSTLTCLVNADKYPILVLRTGFSDADAGENPLATVNIYQGGNVKYSYSNVVAGSLLETTLAFDGGDEDFAVELVCQRYGRTTNYVNRCNLHFLEAKLYLADDSDSSQVTASGQHTPPEGIAGTSTNATSIVEDAEDLIRTGKRVWGIFSR